MWRGTRHLEVLERVCKGFLVLGPLAVAMLGLQPNFVADAVVVGLGVGKSKQD